MTANQRGMSIIEVLVAMVLLLVVILGAYAALDANHRIAVAQEAIADIDSQGRTALEIMSCDLRDAGRTPTGSNIGIAFEAPSAPPMNTAFTSRFDLNGDGDSLDQGEVVQYEWRQYASPPYPTPGVGELVRVSSLVGGGSQEEQIANHVKWYDGNPSAPHYHKIFLFRDSAGNEITQKADVKELAYFVELHFSVLTPRKDQGPRGKVREIVIDSTIVLRNIAQLPPL